MVKNSKFSKKEKFEVLYDCGIHRIKSLCKYSGVSRAQGYRYIDQLETVGHLERKAGSGGSNKIVPKVERKILEKLKNQKKPIGMVALATKTGVSKSTARRYAKKHNFA